MVGFQILVKVAPDTRREFLHTFKLLTRPDKKTATALAKASLKMWVKPTVSSGSSTGLIPKPWGPTWRRIDSAV